MAGYLIETANRGEFLVFGAKFSTFVLTKT